MVLEKTLESPLDCKEIQPVHSKDQSWVFIGRTDAEAEPSQQAEKQDEVRKTVWGNERVDFQGGLPTSFICRAHGEAWGAAEQLNPHATAREIESLN